MDKTFDDLKLGDTVWVNVIAQYFAGFSDNRSRIILVDGLFNMWGIFSIYDNRLSLAEPLPMLKEGQPIWVRSSDISGWVPRFFIAFVDNECRTSAAPNNWNASSNERRAWSRWKLPTSRELVDAGIDPEAWESRD